ncbi:xanthine dehydrogenase molybdopterin binding subunit [Azospira inquinata]|nr:xanthine dehydrogenase molybdopterin binding subunit [Azospira inquinata]
MNTSALPPVGTPLPHESAVLHVTGAATYCDDIRELAGTLHGAPGRSERAHARILAMDLEPVRQAPGVRAVITGADIPGVNDFSFTLKDDPLLAEKEVLYYGHPVFLVVAETHEQARKAARLAKITYEDLPALLTAEAAAAANAEVLPPVEVNRGNAPAALAAAPHRLQGKTHLGGQEHFYLESNIAYAVPKEEDTIHVWSSTQHPSEVQHAVAHALGYSVNQVTLEARRLGGGFGGKESQPAQWACLAAVAAKLTGHPVKVRLDRDDDMALTGKRHDFHIEYDAGFDDRGQLLGLKVLLVSRCGYSPDLSGPVNDRAVFHVDNAYYLDQVAIRSLRGKTHTVSNTAFRGFGGPQGIFAIETVLEDIARYLGLDPLEVRRANFYGSTPEEGRNVTHYGMTVEDNVIAPLVAQLEKDCDYRARRAAIARFNQENAVFKRGLSLTPVKFGISFTATQFNQAGALVHVYSDGTVLANHGGIEMGQGLYTKIRQIVAQELGIPVDLVRLSATNTSKVPNTSATAASSGTDLNGKASQQAAAAIRERLTAFAAEQAGVAPATVQFQNGRVTAGDRTWTFQELVKAAYNARIKLWESGFYKTPKIHYDPKTMRGRPFYYFAYGAAASEVILDTRTGEYRVLRVDVLHDVGRSINPALDLGQIEGGFIQGMGWLTTEELWWRPDGRLMTHAPSTYKIPTAADLPPVFNVKLFDNANVEDSIHKSKAVGEPPLMLPFSVFFALREAVGATDPTGRKFIAMDAPATPETLLNAIRDLAR